MLRLIERNILEGFSVRRDGDNHVSSSKLMWGEKEQISRIITPDKPETFPDVIIGMKRRRFHFVD